MSVTFDVGPPADLVIGVGPSTDVFVGVDTPPAVEIDVGTTGPKGPPGPKGPEGGTPVVALAYDDWPPVDPQPDTLYLRLAP